MLVKFFYPNVSLGRESKWFVIITRIDELARENTTANINHC
jgi:hypothetical protein